MEPEAIPKKAAKKSRPVTMESAAQRGCLRAANRLANTKQAAIGAKNPIPPVRKCSMPCQLMAVASCGVPGGKPRAGSALKIPAPIKPNP